MKKKTQQFETVNVDGKINIIGLYQNLSRMYEIQKVGNFTVSFCYLSDPDDKERSVNPNDIKIVSSFYGIQPVKEGELMVEFTRCEFEDIKQALTRKFETLEEIQQRIKTALAFPLPEIDTIGESGYSLIGTCYQRMNMSLYDVEVIQRISQAIARMAYSSVIKIEHVAEACQYRMIDVNQKNVKVY